MPPDSSTNFNGFNFGAIFSRVTGTISTISSMADVLITSRAASFSVYSRIILGMSVADILASISMSLTTIPMPKEYGDVRFNISGSNISNNYTDGLVLFVEGKKLGNIQTCTIQGFLYTFGTVAKSVYIGGLFVYYACSIAFVMPRPKLERIVEPIIHLTSLLVPLILSVSFLFLGLYNPSPEDAWCTVSTLSSQCPGADISIPSRPSINKILNTSFLGFVALELFVIISCIILVLHKVYRQNILISLCIRECSNDSSHSSSQNLSHELYLKQQIIKVACFQALGYAGVFILTFLFPVVIALQSIRMEDYDNRTGNPFVLNTSVGRLKLIFQPLQGFLNFVIFVGGKVVATSYYHTDLSYYTIFKRVLFSGKIEDNSTMDQSQREEDDSIGDLDGFDRTVRNQSNRLPQERLPLLSNTCTENYSAIISRINEIDRFSIIDEIAAAREAQQLVASGSSEQSQTEEERKKTKKIRSLKIKRRGHYSTISASENSSSSLSRSSRQRNLFSSQSDRNNSLFASSSEPQLQSSYFDSEAGTETS